MKKVVIVVGVLMLLGGGCFGGNADESTENAGDIDRDAILFEAKENGLIMDSEESQSMMDALADDSGESSIASAESYLDLDFKGWDSAALADVTGGESFGLAYSVVEGGVFTLVAKMGNLPKLGDGYFYEGWIVRRGEEMSVISTGRVESSGIWFVNAYTSATDLSDHDFYVLTLEPDDGDPAPAEHILEGTIK